MINRPIVPPPEPPVQKEIRLLKQRVQVNTQELARRKQLRDSIIALEQLIASKEQLLKNPNLSQIDRQSLEDEIANLKRLYAKYREEQAKH